MLLVDLPAGFVGACSMLASVAAVSSPESAAVAAMGLPPLSLPLIAPGVFAGSLYAFMISFGDVPIAIFLSKPGTSTFPVEVFFALEQEFDTTILAASTLVVIFSLMVLLIIQRFSGLDVFVRTR